MNTIAAPGTARNRNFVGRTGVQTDPPPVTANRPLPKNRAV